MSILSEIDRINTAKADIASALGTVSGQSLSTFATAIETEIDRANAVTEAADATVHDAITTLIDGYGQGTPKDKIRDIFYPVGTIYETRDGTFNPNTAWGGEWEKLMDKFLVGAGNEYAIGTEGGEKEHTLTIDEMPSHTHAWAGYWRTPNSGSYQAQSAERISTDPLRDPSTDARGGDQAHNNMPPYIAVNIWKRIA